MGDSQIDQYSEGELILNEDNERNNKKIKLPEELFSSVIKSLKEHKKIIETKEK